MSPFYFCLIEDYFETLAAQLDFIPEDVSVIEEFSFLFEVRQLDYPIDRSSFILKGPSRSQERQPLEHKSENFIIDGIIQLNRFEDLANHALVEVGLFEIDIDFVAFYERPFWESISRFSSRMNQFEFKRALIDQRNYSDAEAELVDNQLKRDI